MLPLWFWVLVIGHVACYYLHNHSHLDGRLGAVHRLRLFPGAVVFESSFGKETAIYILRHWPLASWAHLPEYRGMCVGVCGCGGGHMAIRPKLCAGAGPPQVATARVRWY